MRWLSRCGLWLVLAAIGLQTGRAPARAAAPTSGNSETAIAGASESSGAEDARGEIDLEKLRKHRFERMAIYPMGKRVGRYLEAAEESSSQGDPDKALALLHKLNPERLNPFERAYVNRLLSVVQFGKGDYAGSISSLRKVLDEAVLFPEADNAIRFNIAQLYAALRQWQGVVDILHDWFRYALKPEPLAYYLLAIAHYQLDEPQRAIENAKRAVAISPEPEESWFQLLAALYVQQVDFQRAAPVLEELLIRFPKKQYWVQLSLIYGANERYQGSLAIQQIAYRQEFLTQDLELRRLARSYLFNDLPYPAAQVLEKGLEDEAIKADASAYELLANSWIQAREYDRALAPLRKAAERSDKGDLFARLGQVYMQREDWGAAVDAFRAAAKKGNLDHPGSVDLLLGISYYNDHRVDRARSAFARARKRSATRKQADQWIAHIENELKSS